MKNVIFWDFDGVMSDSTSFVFTFWKEALGKAGYQFEMEDYQKTFMEKFPFDYFQKHFPDVADKIYNEYSLHEEHHYPKEVPAYEGFVSKFQTLPDRYQHFIVSANLKAVILPWIKKYEIDAHFTEILGRETPGHKSTKIEKILKSYNLEAQNCWFIGDTISDMNHANAVNIDAIASTWGVHSKAQLQSAQPKFICDNLTQLFTLLNDDHK